MSSNAGAYLEMITVKAVPWTFSINKTITIPIQDSQSQSSENNLLTSMSQPPLSPSSPLLFTSSKERPVVPMSKQEMESFGLDTSYLRQSPKLMSEYDCFCFEHKQTLDHLYERLLAVFPNATWKCTSEYLYYRMVREIYSSYVQR